MAVRTMLQEERFTAMYVQLVDRNHVGSGYGVLPTPRGILSDFMPLRQPRDVRRYGKHFLRCGCQGDSSILPEVRRSRGIFTPQETIDDTVSQRIQAARS